MQQAEITLLVQTSIGSPKHSVHIARDRTTPAQAAPRVPFPQRRITNPLCDRTPLTQQPLAPSASSPSTSQAQLPRREQEALSAHRCPNLSAATTG